MKLEKVIIGKNYFDDCTIIKNVIMDIILDSNIFNMLPYDILGVELYRQILLFELSR